MSRFIFFIFHYLENGSSNRKNKLSVEYLACIYSPQENKLASKKIFSENSQKSVIVENGEIGENSESSRSIGREISCGVATFQATFKR